MSVICFFAEYSEKQERWCQSQLLWAKSQNLKTAYRWTKEYIKILPPATVHPGCVLFYLLWSLGLGPEMTGTMSASIIWLGVWGCGWLVTLLIYNLFWQVWKKNSEKILNSEVGATCSNSRPEMKRNMIYKSLLKSEHTWWIAKFIKWQKKRTGKLCGYISPSGVNYTVLREELQAPNREIKPYFPWPHTLILSVYWNLEIWCKHSTKHNLFFDFFFNGLWYFWICDVVLLALNKAMSKSQPHFTLNTRMETVFHEMSK